jgi:nucleotide-binding universal stress UspA family protein
MDFTSSSNHPAVPLSILTAIHEDASPMLSFAHALRLTCAAKGQLEVMDVRKRHGHHNGPGIRTTLEQWKMLEPGSSRDDVGTLGIRIKKTVKSGNSRKMIGNELSEDRPDILVIGTAPRKGLGVLFGSDITDYLAASFRQTTLYIPDDARPFVDVSTGEITLRRILLPLATEPSPEKSISMVRRLFSFFPGESPAILAVHAGDSFPPVPQTLIQGLNWEARTIARNGESLAHTLANLANAELADLIIMSTNGRDSFSQKIMGSITEQVVRHAPCPVLAVAVN